MNLYLWSPRALKYRSSGALEHRSPEEFGKLRLSQEHWNELGARSPETLNSFSSGALELWGSVGLELWGPEPLAVEPYSPSPRTLESVTLI